MKRTPLRRARRKPAAVIQADIWREGLGPCAVCKALRVRLNDHVDGHHVIPAQTLRRHGLHDYLVDKRNRLPVCRSHHESHHSRVIPITRVMLPAAVFEFAAEVGLGWWLDKHYPDPETQATR